MNFSPIYEQLSRYQTEKIIAAGTDEGYRNLFQMIAINDLSK